MKLQYVHTVLVVMKLYLILRIGENKYFLLYNFKLYTRSTIVKHVFVTYSLVISSFVNLQS